MASTGIPIATIDATGYHMPAAADVISGIQAAYRGLYGQDIPFDSGDQDTQWLGIQAKMVLDCCTLGLSVYNSFSPVTAQGTGLSSVVKVNGIEREVASYSTVDLIHVGQFGATVTNGLVNDPDGNTWAAGTFTFPMSGQVIQTATCTVLGAITASVGTVWGIASPTKGWQSVTNASDASPGLPVELDPQLRVRQSESTMLPAYGVVDGIFGAISAIPNVARLRIYENDTSSTDINGIPGHSISAIVNGGDATAIGTAIALRKLGSGTYGDVPVTVTTGSAQIPRTILFFRPREPVITYVIGVKSFTGFTIDVLNAIKQAVSDWTNGLGIGVGTIGKIRLSRAEAAAELIGTSVENTFEVTSILVARDGGTPTAVDPAFAFNEAPTCSPVDVTVNVS